MHRTDKIGMRGVFEDKLVPISIGMLCTMASGLVLGTAFLVSLNSRSDQNASRISALEQDQKTTQQFHEDIAVIKNRLDSIDKKLDQ